MKALFQHRYLRFWIVLAVFWIVVSAALRYLTSGIFFLGFLSPRFIVEAFPSQATCDVQSQLYNTLQCSEYQRIAIERYWSFAQDAGVIFVIPLVAVAIAFTIQWTIRRNAA